VVARCVQEASPTYDPDTTETEVGAMNSALVTAHRPSGVLGFAAVSTGDAADAKEADFVEFVRARQQALLRFAYLLTSDHHTAEDLVQTALAKTYLSWDSAGGTEHAVESGAEPA